MVSRRALLKARGVAKLLLHRVGILDSQFRGAFASREDALAAVRPGLLDGYDHDDVVTVSYDTMCKILPWDWPVLFWLSRLRPEVRCLLDAGGHMGTKYRAFRHHLELDDRLRWVVYDVPAVVRAGRERASRDGLTGLTFIDRMAEARDVDLMLGSGLLQYLDIPFEDLMGQLPALPRHLLVNKVATRDGPPLFTLENFGHAEVPYQIRNREQFLATLDLLGYEIIDQWELPMLSHVIITHPSHGATTSRGYYARLRTASV